MKEVRKKSVDPAVNKMLIKAHRQQIDLAWDRAEAMQPQCGFGRMALCCSECQEGPCRVNPFAPDEPLTICGRDRHDLVAAALLRQAHEGTSALLQLAHDFGAELDPDCVQAVLSGDTMMGCAEAGDRLVKLGNTALAALKGIRAAKVRDLGASQPGETEVNLGALQADAANLVVYGHAAPSVVSELAAAARQHQVNLATMSGNEGSGDLRLPILTNYDSQETPLLTGAVDLLIVGRQCVAPAALKLAKTLGIPVVKAAELQTAGQVEQALLTALDHYQARAHKVVNIPEIKENATIGYTATNSAELLQALQEGYAQGRLQGLVYVGGCGNISNTQDAQLVKIAADLLAQGYLIVTAGCAGTALTKAGLCNPAHAPAGCREFLPANTPAVLHIGSCHDAAEFLVMAQGLAGCGLPVLALMPELTHHKNLATALGLAAQGVTVFVGLDWLGQDDQVAEQISAAFKSITGGDVRSLRDFQQVVSTLAKVAATK